MQSVLDKVEEKLKGSFQQIHLLPKEEQPKLWSEMNESLWLLEKTQPESFLLLTQEAVTFLDHGKNSCKDLLNTIIGYRVVNNQFEVKTTKKVYHFPLVSFQNIFSYVKVSNYPHIQFLFIMKPENYFIVSLCYSIEQGLVCVP